jgi:hypothetical protein
MDALDIETKKREKYLKSKIQDPFPHPPTDSEMSFQFSRSFQTVANSLILLGKHERSIGYFSSKPGLSSNIRLQLEFFYILTKKKENKIFLIYKEIQKV